MPKVHDDALDDALLWDGCPHWAGGVVSRHRANLLEAHQASDMLNMDIMRFGVLVTRRGAARLGELAVAERPIQGAAWLRTPTLELLVAAIDGALWKFDNIQWTEIEDFALPSSASQVVMVQGVDKLYITDDSGLMNIHQWDGQTEPTNLGNQQPNEPPRARFLLWHTNRLFVVPHDSDEIHVSSFLMDAPEGAYPWSSATQSLRVGGGDGDVITGIQSWDEFHVLVTKRRSTWLLTTNPTLSVASWPVQKLTDGVGCIAPRSLVQVGKDIWYLDASGVVSVTRTMATEQREISELPISAPIADVFERMNWEYAHTAAAAFWRNRVFVAVPLDAATTPNTVLVYNTEHQAWQGQWTGLNPSVFVKTQFAGQARLCWGTHEHDAHATGRIQIWQDADSDLAAPEESWQDEGLAYPSHVLTRGLVWTEPRNPKKPHEAEIEFWRSQAEATVYVIPDSGGERRVWRGLSCRPADRLQALLPFRLYDPRAYKVGVPLFHIDPARELQFKIAAAAGPLSIRSLTASAFDDTADLDKRP